MKHRDGNSFKNSTDTYLRLKNYHKKDVQKYSKLCNTGKTAKTAHIKNIKVSATLELFNLWSHHRSVKECLFTVKTIWLISTSEYKSKMGWTAFLLNNWPFN